MPLSTANQTFLNARQRFEAKLPITPSADGAASSRAADATARLRTSGVRNAPVQGGGGHRPSAEQATVPSPQSGAGQRCARIGNARDGYRQPPVKAATAAEHSAPRAMRHGLLKAVSNATLQSAHGALMRVKLSLDTGKSISVAEAKGAFLDALLLDEACTRLSDTQLQHIGNGLDRLGRLIPQETFSENWFEDPGHSIMKFADNDRLDQTPGLKHLPKRLQSIATTLSEPPSMAIVAARDASSSPGVQFTIRPTLVGGGILEDKRYFGTVIERLELLQTYLVNGQEVLSQTIRAGLLDVLDLGTSMHLLSADSQRLAESGITHIDMRDADPGHKGQGSQNSQTKNGHRLGPKDPAYRALHGVLDELVRAMKSPD